MEDRIIRLSNIRAAAWTCIILFSLAGYYVFSNMLIPSLMIREITPVTGADTFDQEFSVGINHTVLYTLAVVIFLVVTIHGSVGLLRMKESGLVTFHVCTLLLIIGLLVLIAYFAIEFRIPDTDRHNTGEKLSMYIKLARIISFTSGEVIMLVIAWLLTRANLMLFRKEYRNEFR